MKFKGYVISNPDSHCAGIMSGGVAKGIFLGSNGSGTGLGYNNSEEEIWKLNRI